MVAGRSDRKRGYQSLDYLRMDDFDAEDKVKSASTGPDSRGTGARLDSNLNNVLTEPIPEVQPNLRQDLERAGPTGDVLIDFARAKNRITNIRDQLVQADQGDIPPVAGSEDPTAADDAVLGRLRENIRLSPEEKDLGFPDHQRNMMEAAKRVQQMYSGDLGRSRHPSLSEEQTEDMMTSYNPAKAEEKALRKRHLNAIRDDIPRSTMHSRRRFGKHYSVVVNPWRQGGFSDRERAYVQQPSPFQPSQTLEASPPQSQPDEEMFENREMAGNRISYGRNHPQETPASSPLYLNTQGRHGVNLTRLVVPEQRIKSETEKQRPVHREGSARMRVTEDQHSADISHRPGPREKTAAVVLVNVVKEPNRDQPLESGYVGDHVSAFSPVQSERGKPHSMHRVREGRRHLPVQHVRHHNRLNLSKRRGSAGAGWMPRRERRRQYGPPYGPDPSYYRFTPTTAPPLVKTTNQSVAVIMDNGVDKFNIPQVGQPSVVTKVHGDRNVILAGAIMGGVGMLLIFLALLCVVVTRWSKQPKKDKETNTKKTYRKLGTQEERVNLNQSNQSLFSVLSDEDMSGESHGEDENKQERNTDVKANK